MTSQSPLSFVALGGFNEVGMNCLVIQTEHDAIVVDAGITFGDRRMGIERIYPNFDYLTTIKDKIRAIVLTHGHLDHIGALPFLLDQISAPIYGAPYTIALVEHLLDEHTTKHFPEFINLKPDVSVHFGSLELKPIAVPHSIIDAYLLVVRSGDTTLVHSGDFRLGLHSGQIETDLEDTLQALGQAGVDILLSDSTNSTVDDDTANEDDVDQALEALIAEAPARVVVTLFPSNIERLQSVINIAIRAKRKIALLGRSLHLHVEKASELGKLSLPEQWRLPEHDIETTTKQRVLVIAAGSQGDPRSALKRLSDESHPRLALDENDTVIFSSRAIPGNETEIMRMVDFFAKREIRVFPAGDYSGLHASGHAPQHDQMQLVALLKPHYFVPIHGTPYLLRRHRESALEAGAANALVVENGERTAYQNGKLVVTDRVTTGRLMLQGERRVSNNTLKDRRVMAEFGLISVAILRDVKGAEPLVRLSDSGIAEHNDTGSTLRELSHTLDAACRQSLDAIAKEAPELREELERKARRFLQKRWGFSPLIRASYL